MRKAELALLALLAAVQAAHARAGEPTAELRSIMRRAAYNQLGLLGYCRDLGAVPPEAVETQAAQAAAWPADDEARAAEALGRRGSVEAQMGPLTLARAAARQGVPVPALCRRLALRSREAADAGRRETGLR